MIVISDTSPISNLIELGHLSLLPDLFHQVVIPSAVAAELLEYESAPFHQEFQRAQESGWLEIRAPLDKTLPSSVQDVQLHAGETAAISLALELDADVLLIDERAGFQVAKRLNIQTLGLLGILLQAKESGLVPIIKPLLDQLREEIGFWIAQRLYNRVIELAGEAE